MSRLPKPLRTWKTNDRVFFFPSIGIPVNEGWQIEVHAWCYRLRSHRVVIPLVRKALGFERTRLSPSEKQTFAERARWMFADNRRGQAIEVHAAGEVVALGRTRPNGRLRTRITVKRQPDESTTCEVTWAPLSLASTPLEIHFLSNDGVSVITDIDDTIRISHVHDRGALLRGTFVDAFRAVDGMADVFRAWRQCGVQFHYLSATPWQLYVPIAAFIDAHGFPKGTFHLRDFRWTDRTILNVLASPDRYKLRTIEPLLQRLPRRRFVLVGDSGQHDPEVFGELARRYPRQVQRIFIRDVGRSTPTRYRTAFSGLSRAMWQVFSDPTMLPRVVA